MSNITGMLTGCSLECCQGNLCNLPGEKPTTKPTASAVVLKPPKPTSTTLVYNSTDQTTHKPPKPKSAGLELATSSSAILTALVLIMFAWFNESVRYIDRLSFFNTFMNETLAIIILKLVRYCFQLILVCDTFWAV